MSGQGPISAEKAPSNLAHNSNKTESAAAPPETTSSEETMKWSMAITSLEDAEQWLFAPNVTHLKIQVEHDDFEEVEKKVSEYAKRIFDALLQKPMDPPVGIREDRVAKHRQTQTTMLQSCKNYIVNDEDVKDACALSIMAVSLAVKLHRKGIPVPKLQPSSATFVVEQQKEQEENVKKKNKTFKGRGEDKDEDNDADDKKVRQRAIKTKGDFAVTMMLKCSDRVDKMADAVKENKCIAFDLIKGKGNILFDLASSPEGCLRRKKLNGATNKTRGEQLQDGKKYREQAPIDATTEVDLAEPGPNNN